MIFARFTELRLYAFLEITISVPAESRGLKEVYVVFRVQALILLISFTLT